MTYHIRLMIILCVACGIVASNLYAVPASPHPVKIIQPDGTQITILMRGDEFFHYAVTPDNYMLIKNEDGFYTYAGWSGNEIKSLGVRASDANVRAKQEKKFLSSIPTAENLPENIINTRGRRAVKERAEAKYPVTGSPKSLVILVEYTDVKFSVPDPEQAFSNMLNQAGYSDNNGTGSARDYFCDNSMGVFDPEFVVAGPYTLPYPMAYYGSNYPYDDARAHEMVIDGCRLAAADLDFAEFDTDGDGVIDNVFVFYAGFNEAESYNDDNVWPHRWHIEEEVIIQGKKLYDYACTSELRGRRAKEMCGIGTFVHEFGHVLGLPDYYPTNLGNHHTLSSWNVMDTGSYLNDGKTPPAYSAYDRFYLGWMQPVELKGSQNVMLEHLSQSNKAFIITRDGNHNLNGYNPQPTEFFTLENRQKKGWDSYLPGHGLLITRINYSQSKWDNNTVNNSSNDLGVKIMEADRIANETSLSGDPFPGTANVKYFVPTLHDGTMIENKRIHVREENELIFIEYLESDGVLIPLALDASDISHSGFTANWQATTDADAYRLSVFNITNGHSGFSEDFNYGLDSLFDWYHTLENVTYEPEYCGNAVPAVLFQKTGDFLQTEDYFVPVAELSFYMKPLSFLTGEFMISAWNGKAWVEVDNINLRKEEAGIKTYSFEVDHNYTQFRFEAINITSNIALDDIQVRLTKRLEFVEKNKLTDNTSEQLSFLYPDLDYHYMIRGVKYENGQEKVSQYSNRITVRTDKNTQKDNKIRILHCTDGNLQLYVSTEYLGKPLYIYSTSGVMIRKISNLTYNFVELDNIPRRQLYIVRVGSSHIKFIML